ncbi:Membrane transport protein [anaerobic digester metagenome]
MDVLQTITPIFLLILTGFVLRRASFPSLEFWPQAERLTYYVLFPVLLVDKLTSMHAGQHPLLAMAACLVAAICAVAAALMAVRPRLQSDGPAFTSIFQGAIRPNTYVGLSAAGGLFGDEGLSLSAVALMAVIPTVNVLCVLVLTRHSRDTRARGLRDTVVQLGRNPLILACAAGFALNGADVTLPAMLQEGLHILGSASLPLGLLAVGAGLSFSAALDGWRDVIASSLFKLLALPLLAFAAGRAMGLSGTPLGVCLIFTAVPVSVSSYILARVLGGDHDRMAAIITVQTMLAIVSMPLLLGLLL